MSPSTSSSSFGTVLKEWRGIRRLSQLELSNLAEVSARHISFLESGRSAPSRDMAVHLATALDVPRAERNRLLIAAGFAPIWRAHDLEAEAMAPINQAMAWTLERHNPYPAVILDRHWRVVAQNEASAKLLGALGIAGDSTGDIDLLAEFTEGGALRAIIDNWSSVGHYVLTRLRTESAAVGGDPILDRAIEGLTSDPEVVTLDRDLPPVISADFRIGDACVSLFSTIAQFGTAEDLALAELRIELFFPGDEATRQFLVELAAT